MPDLRRFRVVIDVVVNDPDQVMAQARDLIAESGCPEAADDLDLREAVGWLFDSGSARFEFALEIEGSSTEEWK